MPELIADILGEYEAKAIALAESPQMLDDARQKICKNRVTAPLFNTQLFTRHIADAYRRTFERHHAGVPPGHLRVGASVK